MKPDQFNVGSTPIAPLPSVQAKTAPAIPAKPATPAVPVNPTAEQLAARTAAATPPVQPSTPPVSYASVSPAQAAKPAEEPAVVASSNITEQAAPKVANALSGLSQKGTYVDSAGITRYSDGTLVPAPIGAVSDSQGGWSSGNQKYGAEPTYIEGEDPEAKNMNDLISGLKSSLDANTKRQVDVIEQNHTALAAAIGDATSRATSSRGASLLNLGTSRYAPMAASGTMLAEVTYGLQQLADLDAKENASIAQAYQAQDQGEQELADKALGYVQDIRKQKQDAAQKVIESQQKLLDDARQKQIQATRDSAVADLVSQGITDPKQLLEALNGNGGDFTAEELATTLKNIADNTGASSIKGLTGDVGNFYTLKGTPGALPASILALPADQQLAAYIKMVNDAKKTPAADAGDRVLSVTEASNLGVPYGTRASEAYGKSPGADTVKSLAQQLVSGDLAPAELSKRATGSVSYNDVLAAAKEIDPNFSIAEADRDFKFANAKPTQDTLNYLGSLVGSADGNGNFSGGNLDELDTLSKDIGRTSFPAINDAESWARLSAGSVKYAQFQAVATEVADQVAKILQGGSGSSTSDAKLQQAANLFNTKFSASQLSGIVSALKPLLLNRAKSMVKDNRYLSDYADQFGIDQGGDTTGGPSIGNSMTYDGMMSSGPSAGNSGSTVNWGQAQ